MNNESKGKTSLKKSLEAFMLSRNNYWFVLAFWLMVGLASFFWRMDSHHTAVEERVLARGRLLHHVLLTAHMHASQQDAPYSFDKSFISISKISQPNASNPLLHDVIHRIHTTIPTKSNALMDSHHKEWIQNPLIVSDGHLEFNINNVPAYATYNKPIITEQSCMRCHDDIWYAFEVGGVQSLMSVRYPVMDFLGDLNKQYFNDAALDITLYLVLALLCIFVLKSIRSQYMKFEIAASQVIESEKMASLGSMVAGFSHELKTPIGIAVAASSQIADITLELKQLFGRDEVSEEEIMEPLSTLDESSRLISHHLERAHNMIKEFKSTATDLSIEEKRTFLLHDLFDTIRIDMQHLYENPNIDISISCPSKLSMYGSVGVLKQVMYNLYSNAIKYAFLDGTIEGTISIKCSLVNGQIKIEFRDNGCGMESNTVKHLFEPFYTTARDGGGTGLGMFIVYQLVTKNLSGEIKCASSLGKGTSYELLLPYASPRNDPTEGG
jgi:signal transduction histidine kinase